MKQFFDSFDGKRTRERERKEKEHNIFPTNIYRIKSQLDLAQRAFELLMEYRTFSIKYFCWFLFYVVVCASVYMRWMILILEVRMKGNKIAWIVVIIAFGYRDDGIFRFFGFNTIIHSLTLTTHNIPCNVRLSTQWFLPYSIWLLNTEQNERASERVRAVRTLFTLCTSVNMLIIPKNKLFACIDTTIGKQIFSYSHLIWFRHLCGSSFLTGFFNSILSIIRKFHGDKEMRKNTG